MKQCFYLKKFIIYSLMGMGVCLFALLAGCGGVYVMTPVPSETAAATPEPSATIDWFPATATPTQTPFVIPATVPTLPEPLLGVGAEIIADDFSDTSLWSTSQLEAGNVVYGKQVLSLAVAGNKGILTSYSQHELLQDFYMEMKANISLCQTGDQYGVLFWVLAPGDAYRLVLSCEGRLRLELISGEAAIVLHDWEYGSRILPGSPAEQRIGIWARDGEIRVYVNGAFQFAEKTNPDRGGMLGVFARAGGETAMTVGFSDLVVYQVNPAP